MRWLAALLPWPALIGLIPGNALAPLPTGFACTQASAAAPIVCSGKVPSWDGVPLDADLTIPPGRVSPRPLIVMLHGYANQKTEWESTYAQANLIPWTSPSRHLPMHLAAAVPKYPWSDLVDSLLPNGRASDGVLLPDGDRLSPVGIEKQSYVSYFYYSGNAPNGYYCPQPCVDPSANITAWFARVNAGEPYADPLVTSAVDQLKTWKSAYYQDGLIARTQDLVPVFDIQGWTDQLFPEVEGVSLANKLRAHGWPVKVALADVGHPIAQNKAGVWSALNTQANAFLDHYMMGGAPPALDASAQVTTCDARGGTIYQQPDWASLAPYRVSFKSKTQQATDSATDQPAGPLADPIAVAAMHGGRGACVVLPAANTSPNGPWDFPVTRPFTLLGEAAVHLQATVGGIDAEIDPLLWDVAPDGSATLVTRGAYRFIGSPGAAIIELPLQGNGWDFVIGHTIRLEVTQNDAPYLRVDNAASAIVYKSVRLTLPTPTVPSA